MYSLFKCENCGSEEFYLNAIERQEQTLFNVIDHHELCCRFCDHTEWYEAHYELVKCKSLLN